MTIRPEEIDLSKLDNYTVPESIDCSAPRGQLIPEAKQAIIIDYLKQYDIKIFVETGTAYGDTCNAVLPYVDDIYTVELLPEKWEKQCRAIQNPKIKRSFGHSVQFLNALLPLSKPTLFWLDAHVEGTPDTNDPVQWPIQYELDAIFKSETKGLILADDIWEERFWRPYIPENFKIEWEFGILRVML